MYVAGEKSRGILGEAQLDLTAYGENESKTIKIPLDKCDYEGAYIEVTLKGVEAKAKSTPRNGDPNMSSEQMSNVM